MKPGLNKEAVTQAKVPDLAHIAGPPALHTASCGDGACSDGAACSTTRGSRKDLADLAACYPFSHSNDGRAVVPDSDQHGIP